MAELPEIPERAPWIEAAIHKAVARRRTAKDPFLSMSQIGDCERNLWAGLNGIPEGKEIEPRMLVLFEHGNAVEEHVIRLLTKSGRNVQAFDPETGEQFQCIDFDGRFRGRTDGKIELGSREKRWALLEIKSANTKQFELAQELGYKAWRPKYADQAQVYMGYTELPEALAVVYCKDDSRIYAERLKFGKARFHAMRLKAGRILASEVVLPKPDEAKSQYCGFCKWCPRNAWCWGPLAEVRFDD